MNLRQRLRRAEYAAKRLGYPACQACRQWQGLTLLVSAMPNGTRDKWPPDPCASCGAIPEQIVLLSEVIVPAEQA